MGQSSVFKGILAGAVGGLVASFAMNQFQKVWSAAEEQLAEGKKKSQNQSDGDDATMKTADRVFQAVQGRHLTKAEKKKAGPLVHYAFGAIMGAAYGAAVEINPATSSLAGIPFGTALFAGADEITLPILGLSEKPSSYPLSTHIYGFISHAVYGITTETVRRVLRS